jgi:polyhydroxyalkanoate synthesis regulator protein
MQTMVPKYLEQAMASFATQQEQMRTAMQQTVGTFFPFRVDEVGRQNMAMMERAMSLFSPFYGAEGKDAPRHTAQEAATQAVEEEIASLRNEVERLRAQLKAKG